MDITLKFPISLPDGSQLTKLTMRRPTALDVIASQQGAGDDSDQAVTLLANLCMVSAETFGDLDGADFRQANEAFASLTAFDPIPDYQPGSTITLGGPITVAGVSVSYITLRRPKVKDITSARKSDPLPAKQECALFAALSGLEVKDIQNLDWADYLKIKSIYGDFLE